MTTELTQKLDPQPVTLAGKLVRLEPLDLGHTQDLYDAGADDAIWRYLPRPGFAGLEDAEAWVRQCLTEVSGGGQGRFRGDRSGNGPGHRFDIILGHRPA